MSIQRYKFHEESEYPWHSCVLESDEGNLVLYTDHAAEVERLTAKLKSSKSLNVEKDQTISALMSDRNQLDSDLAKRTADVERLTAERDKLRKAMAWWRSKYRTLFKEATETVLVVTRNFVKMKHRSEAAEAERDSAVCAVKLHCKECQTGVPCGDCPLGLVEGGGK